MYYVLALDVETSGSSLIHHGLVSIGATLQDHNSTEIDAFQVNLQLPEDRSFEQRCLEEFWLKNPLAYEFVQKNALPPKAAMDAFCQFLQKVEESYPDLMVVSDNPSFDIAWLNFYLDLYTTRFPLNYSIQNEYRFIWDVHSMLKSLIVMMQGTHASDWELSVKLGFKTKYSYDHTPLNDARVIADYFNQAMKAFRSCRQQIKP
jgi:hypothetical protein